MSLLDDATALAERTRVELEAKGYSPPLARAAVERARKTAFQRSQPISVDIRERAYYDLVVYELQHAEEWIQKVVQGMTSAK